MRVHILGIAGTFMAGIAKIARELGYEVSGADQQIYPPMSDQLADLGIHITQGYENCDLNKQKLESVIMGNAMSRGKPIIEHCLNENIPYESGPEWLYRKVLQSRWVIAVSGTHGKTTTSSMVAWILEHAGLQPGFLIGGIPANFGVSARLGNSRYFVIEADEYDTAFFDKRSKFLHYRPRTCIINNIEFDHADIFDDIGAIKKQFHHLVRTIPQQGSIIYPFADKNIVEVLEKGCWSQTHRFGLENKDSQDWSVKLDKSDGSAFSIYHQGIIKGSVGNWDLYGEHNVQNALAAIIAAHTVGVDVQIACDALVQFKSVKRRLEKIGSFDNVCVYDDFAHHPTAIAETLKALRSRIGQASLKVILDLRSNTMKMGVHRNTLVQSLKTADQIWVYQSPDVTWPVKEVFASLGDKARVFEETTDIIKDITRDVSANTHICIMSNGGFDNLHQRLLQQLDHVDHVNHRS